MRPIRILLADDHDLFRAGLRALLQGLEGIEVIAEASDGREALSLLKEHRADIVLMDMMMPGLNGLDATGQIVREFPNVRVIILSMNSAEEFVLPALRAGASGYVLKNAKAAELERAIRAVARGETYLMPAISGHAHRRLPKTNADDNGLRAEIDAAPARSVAAGRRGE